MGEQSLEMFFVGVVAGKEVPAMLMKQKRHLMNNDKYTENPFVYDYSNYKPSSEVNHVLPVFDHLPSMGCIFNGPMIRVPSAWDKEVSELFYKFVFILISPFDY